MSAAFTTRPEIIGTFGAVSSTHWLASAVGMSILERGGNAFDAAVATGITLQIVEPHLSGPAGDMPAILYSARDRAVRVLCAQGTAPAAATVPKFRELGLTLIPGTGFLAAAIPGAFDGWMLLLRDYGTMTVEQVLEPAIGYAENGFPVLPRVTMSLLPLVEFFKAEWPSSAAVWLPDGEPPKPGTLYRTPGVAATYKRIVAEAKAAGGDRERQIEAARDAFYRGFVAEAIDRFATRTPQMDGTGRRNVGLLTAGDMAGWRATWEDSASYDYGRWRVHKTGPWGQGPVLLQQLALLKGYDLAALDPNGAEFVHVVTECAKLAFADREAFYGDPAFAEVPLATLLSDAYNDSRRELVGKDASLELRPGLPELSTPQAEDDAGARGIGDAGRTRRRRADIRAVAGISRRHRASRHHRPLGQHDRRHAERRMVSELARHPRARFPSGNARADVLARRGPAVEPDPRRATAHDALADAGGARRRALSRLRFAWRRPAGSMDPAAVAPPFSSSQEPARGDRRADVQQHAFPELLHPASRQARRARNRGSLWRRRRWPS